MHFGVDIVAGSVNEILFKPRLANHAPANVVNLPAMYRPAGSERLLDEFDGSVASIPDYFKHLDDTSRSGGAGICGPCYVGVYRAGPVHFGPQIYQYKIGCTNRRMAIARRLVVRR